jgi:ribonuclease HI
VTKNFTDGSVWPKGAGYAAAIYDEKGLLFVIKESLPSYISIFQAEGFAILAALQWILQSAYPLTQKFELYSDSKAALLASTPSTAAKSTTPFSLIVSILATRPNINLFWIPSHSGHQGNDMADKMAKEAAKSWADPHPPPHMLKAYAKKQISCHINSLWDNEWKTSNAAKSTHDFFPTLTDAKILNVTPLAYQTLQLLSGHCRLNSYLFRFKHIPSPSCTCSQDEEESVPHYILTCPHYSSQRLSLARNVLMHSISWPPKFSTFSQSKSLLSALNNFILETNRLNTPPSQT